MSWQRCHHYSRTWSTLSEPRSSKPFAQSIDPNIDLILLSLSEGAASRVQAGRLATRVTDWPALIDLARRHRVSALLATTLRDCGAPVPSEAASILERNVLERRATTMLLEAELRRAVTVLARSHVPALVLKGAALANGLYPNPSCRPYRDIDIAVPPRMESAAADALRGAGFVEDLDPRERRRRRLAAAIQRGASFHRVFRSCEGRAVLELHTDMLQLGIPSPGDRERWQRATACDYIDGAQALTPEDELVVLAVHAHKHGFLPLLLLKDIDLVLRKLVDQRGDWGLVVQSARTDGVAASVWYATGLAASLLDSPTPPELSRLRPNAIIRRLYAATWPPAEVRALRAKMRRRAVQFDAIDSWRGLVPSILFMGRRTPRVAGMLRYLLLRDPCERSLGITAPSSSYRAR